MDKKEEEENSVRHKNVILISDIEGSSCCADYQSTTFLSPSWPEACLGMTLDTAFVVKALLESGVETVHVKDFHRTAHNLLPEKIDPRAKVWRARSLSAWNWGSTWSGMRPRICS